MFGGNAGEAELAASQRPPHLSYMVALAILLGCALIAWAVFFVGRRIARVLWGILGVIEKDEIQKKVYEEQKRRIFG